MTENEKRIYQRLKDDYQHYAAKCLKIRSKEGKIEPFLFNEGQKYLHEIVEDQRRRTGKVRVLVLKGRQVGISTYVEGRFYWKVTHRFGVRAFILTHDTEATNNLFDMAKRYHENCHEFVKPSTELSNAKELIFGKLDSGYKLGTAGNKAVGRSSTIQYLHGCLCEGTLIFDPNLGSIRKIEEFKIGDVVQTHTKEIALISYISSQKKECLSISLRTLTAFPLIATKEHRFWTKNGWKKLGELKIGDSIGYPVHEIKNKIKYLKLPIIGIRAHGGGSQFNCPNMIKLNNKFGKIIGLYLAEGHLKRQLKAPNNCSSIEFAVHRKEVERTLKWLECFKIYYSSISVRDVKNCLTSKVTIYGNRFASLIEEFCGRVNNKHIPYDWKSMPSSFVRGILQGYISGDGSSYNTDRRVRASSIHAAITFPLRDIAAALGYGWASIEYKAAGIRHNRNEKEKYTFSLCGNGASKLAKEIGKPTPSIKRIKTNSIKEYAASTTEISNGYAWLRIRSIENIGIKKVYDFEIDHEDHSYCTIHGASHNSETGFWPNASEHAKGVLQAVPNAADTEIFLESTANGIGNYFHEQWQLAEAGLSDFIPIFIPWHWMKEYVREVPPEFSLDEEEVDLKEIYKLTDEQLCWRRYKIIELSASGADGRKAFQQEYPFTSTEAFITTGEDSFITPSQVMPARKCEAEGVGLKLLGVDPARFGDDRTSIIRRQGRKAYGLESYIKKDTMEIAGIVHNIIMADQPDKVFIDVIGIGAGVHDRLLELGHGERLVAVNSATSPLDGAKFINRRAEMWANMKEWLLDQPCQIPDSDSLHADLCSVRYKFDSKGRMAIEKKEDLKKRGLRSPDEAEALLLTFYYPAIALLESNKRRDAEIAKTVMSSYNHQERLRKLAFTKR